MFDVDWRVAIIAALLTAFICMAHRQKMEKERLIETSVEGVERK